MNVVMNYRMWIFLIMYGYCFGVELIVDNIIVEYFYDWFNFSLFSVGIIVFSFGFMNIVFWLLGGILLDIVVVRFGMWGWLWNLWII